MTEEIHASSTSQFPLIRYKFPISCHQTRAAILKSAMSMEGCQGSQLEWMHTTFLCSGLEVGRRGCINRDFLRSPFDADCLEKEQIRHSSTEVLAEC
jgi:hypothetical protein